ncbi:uncharacterized protein BDZ83DRAFT_276391 [Colletotrichum acutatum]|uniref:Uncharacterized protein n=1 Tax=Glomerella acutata TaxID=27357 RepID=A0AAD8UQF8_GLOAC|nr:uncharacterized protein BDZ83DRAFT_276391 [Colletotrichum acutatum]KAK1726019.1 hypothetical protein BDZ83DRAFT_276391 [Colletotrichum acutatum]
MLLSSFPLTVDLTLLFLPPLHSSFPRGPWRHGPWQLPYLRQLQPFEIVASLLDSNDHKKAEPQAQPGKTRILDGNHPPGPLHYSLTAPPSKVPSNTLASTSHNTTSPHKPKATTIHLNLVYATLHYLHQTTPCLCDHGYQSCQIADPSVPREPPGLV